MQAIRAFIAIEMPTQLQNRIQDVVQQVNTPRLAAVRWVAPHNIHLTLKFLGEISPDNLKMLSSILTHQASQVKPFELQVGKLGVFPHLRQPRVMWVGVQAPEELAHMQKRLEAETHRLGYPTENRPFSPHLTLGRVSHNANPSDLAEIGHRLESIDIGQLGTVWVEQVILFRSDLQPGGAVYSPLFQAHLQ